MRMILRLDPDAVAMEKIASGPNGRPLDQICVEA